MAQQMVTRSLERTGQSRTGYSSYTQPERPHSSSSKSELTGNKAGLDQGITKTTAWETSTEVQQDAWSNVSEQETHSQAELQPANVVSAKSKAWHP